MSDQAPSEDLTAQLRRLQGDLDAIKETLKQTGRREAQSAIDNVEAYARDNPRTVIAGAVGLGVLLGLMLRRH
ncbi:MAG: hypothetical protein WC670_11175 [Pseudolabrys sp.]|jgi:ElaB/YqjD/DUF883 family membrane-anchored ribosome-binding protein